MKSIEWIDTLIRARKLPSDRQAALLMGMSSALMSNHRNGKAQTLDDKYAYRLEELLDLPHGRIVLDQHAERERDPAISAMWRRLAATAASILLTLTFCSLTLFSKPADAKEIHITKSVNALYIMRTKGSRAEAAPRHPDPCN